VAERLVICDTGPIVSALNRRERSRHEFAAELLDSYGARAIIPWPVYVETDLLLRNRGFADNAVNLGRALLAHEHSLVTLTDEQLAFALTLLTRFQKIGLDLPDASVMALSISIDAPILTWDFRHFRAVVPSRGVNFQLLVSENELPAS